MAINAKILRSIRRFVTRKGGVLNEIDVYARRLLSYDQLTPKELAVYVTRRRQALLFFAIQNDPVFRAWKEEHPEEARFCSDVGWASIPVRELTMQPPGPTTVAQRANAARVLAWWSRDEQPETLEKGVTSRRLKHVGHPSDLKKVSLEVAKLSAEIPCLSLGEWRILAAPCPESGEYHFLSDVFLIESLGSQQVHHEGEQCLTDLDSRAELLIRRRLPFKVNFKAKACPCGRPFPILDLET